MRRILLLLTLIAMSISVSGQWQTRINNGDYFYIRVAGSSKYWDVPGKHPVTAESGRRFQISGQDNDTYERSFLFYRITGTNKFAIVNKAGFVVEVGGRTTPLTAKEAMLQARGRQFELIEDDGAPIQIARQEENGFYEWQQWIITVVDPNRFMLENAYTGKMVTIILGEINEDGSELVSSRRTNSAEQQFVLEYATGERKGQLFDFDAD